MFVTRISLPRRTFLRGIGATLALPFLDGMIPAFASRAQAASASARRLSVVYVPNGVQMESWTPVAEGAAFDLTPSLQPLASYRNRLVVVSGLTNAPAFPGPGEGSGAHVRASATFLTGAHPKRTEGPDIRAGVSLDQIAARTLGRDTQLGSLELCLESNDLAGACEAGYSCAYANTLAWRDQTTPLPMENHPRAVFERLFGDSDDTTVAARRARILEDRSILDLVTADVSRLQRALGADDRTKLVQYLDAVRDVERRIQKAEEQSARELPAIERPVGIPSAYDDHAKLMFDLQVLAYQCDLTRVTTFMMGREVSPKTYPEIGITDSHHGLSHHGGNVDKIAKVAKINAFHVTLFGYFLGRLAGTPDGDGSLLDHVTVLYGSGMSNGNDHTHTDLPMLVAGGAIARGRHLRCPKDTPLTNLQLTLLDRVGVPVDHLGDSTGAVAELSDI